MSPLPRLPVSLVAFTFLLLHGCGPSSADDSPQLFPGTILETRAALAPGPATLVKDVHAAPLNLRLHEAQGFTSMGSALYFSASVGETGEELWRTDGTPEGTTLVKDIVPGPADSSPRRLTVWKGSLYFLVFLPRGGISLYSSDGTSAGTVPRAVLHPEGDREQPISLSNLALTRNGLCIALGYSESTRNKLLCTDGTAQGTVRIPGPWETTDVGTAPYNLWVLDEVAYFRTEVPGGAESWRTDGTPQGTYRMEDRLLGGALSGGSFVLFQGAVYFRAPTPQGLPALWRSNGSPGSSVLVKELPDALGCGCILTTANGVLWLTASSPETGDELWKSDGTPQGTVLVKDLYPGSVGSSPERFFEAGGATIFWAWSPGDYRGLWRTDGTPEGTVLLQQSTPSSQHSFNGVTYFAAVAPGQGEELWRTDGTVEGTRLVKDLSPGEGSSSPRGFVTWNGTLFFQATDAEGYTGLWRSDGTPEGTRPVLDVSGPTGHAFPRVITPIGSRLYFHARDAALSAGLWTSDGTAEGTVLLHASLPLTPPASPWLAGVEGRVLFRGSSVETGTELWLTDGTPGGTRLLKDISEGSPSSTPELLTQVGETVYFRARDSAAGSELWLSDGTPEGTRRVTDLVPGTGSSVPSNLTPMGHVLYFSASTPETGTELWRTDGTPEGTRLVKDFVSGTGSGSPGPLFAVGDTLYAFTGSQLWKSDGTPEGTVLVKDIGPGQLEELTRVGSSLYFLRTLPFQPGLEEGVQLWRSDGTPEGTMSLLSARGLEQLTSLNGTLYFFSDQAAAGYALWRTDGTSAGTVQVKPLQRGWWTEGAARVPARMLGLEPERRLIFAAADEAESLEPWMSDGTPEGTVRIHALAPGPLPSTPAGFARLGERVYFSANEGMAGQELWALPVSELHDRTPPELTCPAPVIAESPSAGGQPVDYPAATVRDAYTASPAVTYSHPSGSTFEVGETTVTVTATDERGNSATCSFTVTVKQAPPPGDPGPEPSEPKGGCGCGASGLEVPWLTLMLGSWLARRRRGAVPRS